MVLHKSVHVIAEAQGAGLQRELVVSGLGTRLVPEEVARTWMLRYPDSQALVIVRPAKKQLAIAAALISTKRTSRLRQPIDLLGMELTEAFAARPSKTNRRSSSQGNRTFSLAADVDARGEDCAQVELAPAPHARGSVSRSGR